MKWTPRVVDRSSRLRRDSKMATYNLEMFVLYTFFGSRPIDKILRRWRIRLDVITQNNCNMPEVWLKEMEQ